MTRLKSFLHKYNPAVKKEYLFLPAGLMWIAVGIMMCTMAVRWLTTGSHPFPFALAGVTAGALTYSLGFSVQARKNIDRITMLQGKRCFFSFMTLKSYFIVIVMMTMGMVLRHSPVDRSWLSVIYNGIGIGLGLAGLHYFSAFLRLWKEPH